jgi:hypothetical protein
MHAFPSFRLEVVSVTRGRRRPEMTSPFNSSSHFCVSGQLTFFVHVFPFKSYSTFSFYLKIAVGAEILRGFWSWEILDPLIHAHINKTSKRHLLMSNRVV